MVDEIEFEDEIEPEVQQERFARFNEAVLYSTDWTVETILSQLRRGNIQLNPNFQRRDAWNNSRKSLFIESIVVGLPIPQLVLAESREPRGERTLYSFGREAKTSFIIQVYWRRRWQSEWLCAVRAASPTRSHESPL